MLSCVGSRKFWSCEGFSVIERLETAGLEGKKQTELEWKRNLVAHGDAREEKWRGKRRMEWVAKQSSVWLGTVHPVLLQTFSPDLHSKKASTRLNWHPRRYKWTRPFRWKTESGFCACAITFRFHSTNQRCVTSQKNEGLPLECSGSLKSTLHSCCHYLRLQLSTPCLRSKNIFCAAQFWRVAQTASPQLRLPFYTCYRIFQLSRIGIWAWK